MDQPKSPEAESDLDFAREIERAGKVLELLGSAFGRSEIAVRVALALDESEVEPFRKAFGQVCKAVEEGCLRECQKIPGFDPLYNARRIGKDELMLAALELVRSRRKQKPMIPTLVETEAESAHRMALGALGKEPDQSLNELTREHGIVNCVRPLLGWMEPDPDRKGGLDHSLSASWNPDGGGLDGD